MCFALATATRVVAADALEHREYVVQPGTISVYDLDANFALLKSLPLAPTLRSNIKGVAVSVRSARLYVSYGGDGGANGFGSVLALDLLSEQIIWSRNYA